MPAAVASSIGGSKAGAIGKEGREKCLETAALANEALRTRGDTATTCPLPVVTTTSTTAPADAGADNGQGNDTATGAGG